MKYFIPSIIASILLISAASCTLNCSDASLAKDASHEIYRLLSQQGIEISVSKELIDRSPTLKKLAQQNKSSSFSIACKEEWFPVIGLVNNLLTMTPEKGAAEIRKLSTDSYVEFMKVLYYLGLRDLVNLSLQVYQDTLSASQNLQSTVAKSRTVSTLVNLASSCIARHIDISEIPVIETFPPELQINIFHKIPLNYRNFRELYQWMERLNEYYASKKSVCLSEQTKKTPPAPLEFTSEQYDSLASIADFMRATVSSKKAIVKELTSLTGQKGKIKLALLRNLLHADRLAPLNQLERLKIGWLLMVKEQSAEVKDVIFDELAFFIVDNKHDSQRFPEWPIYFSCTDQEVLENRASTLLYIKARLRLLYDLLGHLNVPLTFEEISQLKSPNTQSVLDYCMPFSTGFLIRQIEQIRKMLAYKSLRNRKFLFHELLALLDCKMPAVVTQIRNLMARIEQEKPVLSDIIHLVRYTTVASFSQMPFTIKIGDKKKQSCINTQLLDEVSKVLSVPESADRSVPAVNMDSVYSLFSLFAQGAELTAQNHEGNTVAHLAFASGNLSLLVFIWILITNKLSEIDMHCPNNKKLTPLMLLHQIEPNKHNIGLLSIIIRASKQKFSPSQLAQVPLWLEQTDIRFIQNNIEKIINNKSTGLEQALWFMRSPKSEMRIENRLVLAWLFALKATNQLQVNELLGIFSDISKQNPKIVAHFIPESLNTHLLYSYNAVKELKKGNRPLPETIDVLSACNILQLLKFSRYLWQYLYKLESNSEQSQKLLQIARIKNNETDLEALCLCLLQGADINSQDENGNTVFHYKILQGELFVLRMLLKVFEVKINCHKKNTNGCTPLILAAQHETDAPLLVTFLLDGFKDDDLDVFATDNSGHTAFNYLQMKGHEKDVAYHRLSHYLTEATDDSDFSDSHQGPPY